VTDPEFEVEVAARLEREARRRLDTGTGTRELALALDQLCADRANGESLGLALEQVRRVLERIGTTDLEEDTR
jgi:hypothetical protein